MNLKLLYTLTGTAVVEKLGKVQGGERIKIEFRGQSGADSPIEGKAHGSSWALIGPLGPGEANAVQELITPAGERLVVELRGYSIGGNGAVMDIRASGTIRSSAARFTDLNGRLALVVHTVAPDDAVSIHAYEF